MKLADPSRVLEAGESILRAELCAIAREDGAAWVGKVERLDPLTLLVLASGHARRRVFFGKTTAYVVLSKNEAARIGRLQRSGEPAGTIRHGVDGATHLVVTAGEERLEDLEVDDEPLPESFFESDLAVPAPEPDALETKGDDVKIPEMLDDDP